MSTFGPIIGGLTTVILALAFGLALLPKRSDLPRSRYEEYSIAYLLGVSIFTVGITALYALGLETTFYVRLAILAIGMMCWKTAFRREKERVYEPLGFAPYQVWMLALLALGSIALTLSWPINQFDPMLHFAYKGKLLLHHGTPFGPALSDLQSPDGFGRMATHPNYPLGIPILESFASGISFGGWSDRWVQIPLAFWAACLPGAVAFGLRFVSKPAARWGALLMAAVPMIYLRDGFSSGGLGGSAWGTPGLGNIVTLGAGADLPVAACFAAGVALLLRAGFAGSLRLGLAAGFAFAGAAMMKNEGLALFGVVVIAVLISGALFLRRGGSLFKDGRKAIGISLFVGLLAVAPWLHLRSQMPAIDENYSEQLTLENTLHFLGGGEELAEQSPKVIAQQKTKEEVLAELPPRRAIVGKAFAGTFADFATWGPMWLLMFAALGTLLLRRGLLGDPLQRILAAVVFGGVLMYALILLVTPWYLPLLLEKGIPERLLLHLVGPIVLLVGWWIADAKQTIASANKAKAH